MSKNIVEAYIEFNGQLIILVSGLPGCGKLTLANNISRDLKIKLLEQDNYFKKDYNDKIEVKVENDTIEIINWYTDDAIDWEKFNKDIDLYKDKGVVVSGFSLPIDKIINKIDFHIHLNISKQLCLERRVKCSEQYKKSDIVDKVIMNKFIYPYYIEARDKSKIDKYLNITNLNDDQVYDTVFDLIIEFIKNYIKNNETKFQKNNNNDECKNIKITAELLEPTNLFI